MVRNEGGSLTRGVLQERGNGITEEFMTFLLLERITGRYIAEKIMEFLKDNDLPVENIRGQGLMVPAICPLSVLVFKHKYEKCLHLQHISTAVHIN